MTVLSDAKNLLRHAKAWSRHEAAVDRTLRLLAHHKRGMAYSRTDRERERHTKKYHKRYRQLAALVQLKTKIEYDIHKIHKEIEREIARRRKKAA